SCDQSLDPRGTPQPAFLPGESAPRGTLHVLPAHRTGTLMKNGTPTVFVVDDDDAVRSSLRLLFKSYGLDAVMHASADEFLAGYDISRPGCLVLDVRMPGLSGPELQQRLNALGATIPIVFITGHGDVPMAVEAMQAGAFDFLQKPFRD